MGDLGEVVLRRLAVVKKKRKRKIAKESTIPTAEENDRLRNGRIEDDLDRFFGSVMPKTWSYVKRNY